MSMHETIKVRDQYSNRQLGDKSPSCIIPRNELDGHS